MPEDGYIRIGELSRRTGVSPELLRAWERRYGLFTPDRSPGRFRLYSDTDVLRVEAMRGHLARGLSAAQAARLVVSSPPAPPPEHPGPALAEHRRALWAALLAFDEPGANAALDELLASVTVMTLLREVVLPLLRELGDGWERGEITVAQEHFASNVLRGRLLALGRGWGRGTGPHALLAAPPGELHDLGLVALGLALRDRGWRVTFLGADTPIDTLSDTAAGVRPTLVVLASVMPSRTGAVTEAVASLARRWPVVLAGDGVSEELAARIGARFLTADPIEAAELLASSSVPAVS
jgi:DNA-binding transcriptional MerR regulator